MASTDEQDLNGQSSLQVLLGENENHSTITMGSPKRETLRFESFPLEIRNVVYRHLFPPLCKGSRPRMNWPFAWYQPLKYEGHDAYSYDTAILRSNHLIGQEAKSVLYGNNMFVLFSLTNLHCAHRMILRMLKDIAWNPIRKGAPVPSCVVQIDHGRQADKPAGYSFIVAAADVKLICEELIDEDFCCLAPRAAYSLVGLPQLGWQHERLLTMIWLPLKAFRKPRHTDFRGHEIFTAGIKVIDRTGVFEQTVEDESSDSDSTEDESSDSDSTEDESDGSGSEDSESCDDNSCAEEEDEEEDIEDVDRTANGSDDVVQEESNGDEAGTSGESGEGDSDEAVSVKSHEHRNNNSISSHDGDANAQITIVDNNAAQGCSGEDTGHQTHDDVESKADVDTITYKTDAQAE
ncbi:hypothetical protein BDR22DRAFT_545815 [Usnea florida]